MIYTCCHPKRAARVRDHATLNGIEYLEVLDKDAPPGSPRQRTLLVRCYKAVPEFQGTHVRIEGGTRIRPVLVDWAFPANSVATQDVLTADEAALVAFIAGLEDPAQVLVVRTEAYGDFSIYTLRLVAGPGLVEPPPNFDPVLAAVEFSFKAECPTPFDCYAPRICPPDAREAPLINYLAKDYASFRRLMLDRLALLLPQWTERNPADVGVALVELLAYVGDSLSYRQDAVATEAYLETARRRVSVRRHARLVDYFMHDGSNARVWVQIQAKDPSPLVVPAGTQILSKAASIKGPVVEKDSQDYFRALNDGVAVFETMHHSALYSVHNELFFYTWGDDACVLCKGATRATLKDSSMPAERLLLRSGDVVILEERLGPEKGIEADANPTRRHAVRLTKVEPEATLVLTGGIETGRNPVAILEDPLTGQAIVKIEWHDEDALPFPLCISAPRTDTEFADQVFADVSVARGNVVLADHGLTTPVPEKLGTVPSHLISKVAPPQPTFCEKSEAAPVLPRFRPTLRHGPVTQVGHVLVKDASGTVRRAAFDPQGSAASAFRWDIRRTFPAIEVTSDGSELWAPERELLDSRAADRHFVVEVEADGSASLRFGDGELGMRPEVASKFTARYRVGNGSSGNVGYEVLAHLVDDGVSGIDPTAVQALRNPFPAAGGVEPESAEEVRQKAPYAFRTQERAVTLDDYAEVSMRHPGLQRAAARFRWTGSWRTVFVTPDPLGGDTVDYDPAGLREHLERFRLAGYDLEVDDPRYVSLEIELEACVKRGFFSADVERALLEVFSNRVRADGRKGLFHPDRFSFGEPVYLSPLYEAALAVEGVDSVRFLTFRRQGRPDRGKALKDGRILLNRLEIARLDNDPNFPEHGTLRVTPVGVP